MIIWIFPESLRSPTPSPLSLLKVLNDCKGADADINQIKLEQRRVGGMSYINGTSKRLSVSTGLLNTLKLVKTEIQ